MFSVLHQAISGQPARRHVEYITGYYRSPGSSGFHAVLDYAAEALRDGGVEYTIQSYPLDGQSTVLGERLPLSWEPESAALEVAAPQFEPLLEFDDCPSCLPWWCPPTPEGGAELELVDVGAGTSEADYAGKDVAGKAVLVRDTGERLAWADIVELAQRHGARGLICDILLYQYEPWRTRSGFPEAVQLMRLPARWENPWTFTVSHTVYQRLAALLAAGPVRLRFRIAAKTFEGQGRSLLATIPGEAYPEEAVYFVAHASAATKPGANCASGVGLLLEIATTVQDLIQTGRLPRPKRSLKFLFEQESYGTLDLFNRQPQIRRDALGSFVFCSVGHNQGLTKSSLILGRSPDSTPTFLNDFLEDLIDEAPKEVKWGYRDAPAIPLVNWKAIPYTPWSSNHAWAGLGVPSLLVMSLPDRFFHTQLLTADKTDPAVFRRVGTVTAAAALYVAGAEWPEAGHLMRRVLARAEGRLAQIALRANPAGLAPSGDEAAARRRLRRAVEDAEYVAQRDTANLRSALALVRHAPKAAKDEAEALAARYAARLQDAAESVIQELRESASASEAPAENGVEDKAARLFPKHGPQAFIHGLPGFDLAAHLALAAEMAGHDPAVVAETLIPLADEVWNLSNGERSLAEIVRGLRYQFDFNLETEHILEIVNGMREAGVLELTEAQADA